MKKISKPNRVFLGGGVNNTWRDDLIKLLPDGVEYFNPIVSEYNDITREIEEDEKENKCNIHLFVNAYDMEGGYKIDDAIKSATDRSKTTIFTVIPEGFTESQLEDYETIKNTIKAYNGIVCEFDEIPAVISSIQKASELEQKTGDVTTVICGFPGVGKSKFVEINSDLYNVLDSDSSEYSWMYDKDGNKTNVRNPEFPQNYINHIKENIGKVDVIFTSTHDTVIKALMEEGIRFNIIYPDPMARNIWLNRIAERGSSNEFCEMLYNNWWRFMESIENVVRGDKGTIGGAVLGIASYAFITPDIVYELQMNKCGNNTKKSIEFLKKTERTVQDDIETCETFDL